jgi:uncharacterized RDD family membrane protein YckC
MNGWQIFVEVAGRPPYEVRPGESIIGRSRMAQVHINESTVSRQHARILASPLGEVTIEDLGSSNGTYVNNEKIEGRRRLADGDRVHVGDAELRVRIVAPVAASEATVRMTLPPMTAPMGGPPPAAPLPTPLSGPVDLPLAPPLLPAAPPPPRTAAPAAPIAPVTAPVPNLATVPTPAPPAAAPAPIAPPPAAAPRPTPPTFEAPRPAAAPPPSPAPASAPAPAPTPLPSGRPASMRTPELPSVTVIDRIPIPEPSPEVILASKLSRAQPAGFGIRLAAMLIDAALVTFVSIPVWIVAQTVLGGSPVVAGFLVPGIMGLLSTLYTLVFWATKGATPGKIFLKLRILGAKSAATEGLGWGTAIVRALGYMVSGALLGIGFLLVLFTSQKQGLHDLIAGTRVVRLR